MKENYSKIKKDIEKYVEERRQLRAKYESDYADNEKSISENAEKMLTAQKNSDIKTYRSARDKKEESQFYCEYIRGQLNELDQGTKTDKEKAQELLETVRTEYKGDVLSFIDAILPLIESVNELCNSMHDNADEAHEILSKWHSGVIHYKKPIGTNANGTVYSEEVPPLLKMDWVYSLQSELKTFKESAEKIKADASVFNK